LSKLADIVRKALPAATRDNENLNQQKLPLRERLLNAAEKTIAERGLAALKARELAADAGCALGAIYTVFDDLDELVLRVNSRTLERLERALDAALGETEATSALGAMARAYLNFARREEPSWRALFEHRLARNARVPDWYVEQRNRLFSRLDAPLAQLLAGRDAAARAGLARTLFSAVHGVVALGLEEKIADTPPAVLDAQLETLVRLIAHGLMMESARWS
jgi:AcrR family transcriptional regulator